ncbi:MAG: lipopolysaccharide transport periplasmic protein LptA [Nitrosomonadales bacterium]|nr:MAG: lipopolysaccharide transport periplasmic protein LptA [Nitrosomonadales bacterium]
MKSISIIFIFGILFAGSVLAERTDSDKPVHLESDSATVENAGLSNNRNRTSVFNGNVVLTQGTLIIRSDKMVVKEDENGFQNATAYGNLASFRQKRDGMNEYIEGWSERMEYDSKADKVELFKQARLRRGADEVQGDYISYEATTEFFQVNNGAKTNPNSDSRVRAVIQPKKKKKD